MFMNYVWIDVIDDLFCIECVDVVVWDWVFVYYDFCSCFELVDCVDVEIVEVVVLCFLWILVVVEVFVVIVL